MGVTIVDNARRLGVMRGEKRGLIDRLFGKPKAAGSGAQDTRFETITAYSPVFTSWGGRIYESELVRAAVDARARHVAKLSYRMTGTARPKLATATKTACRTTCSSCRCWTAPAR